MSGLTLSFGADDTLVVQFADSSAASVGGGGGGGEDDVARAGVRANEDAIGELRTARNSDIRFLPQVSPGYIDKTTLPARYIVGVKLREGAFSTAATLRLTLGGITVNQAVNVGNFPEISGAFGVTTEVRAALGALAAGTDTAMVARLLDGDGVTIASSEYLMEVVETPAHPDALTSIAQDFNSFLAEPTADFRVYDAITYAEAIASRDDLDGDYVAVLSEPDNLGYGARGVDVDSVRIYVRGADLATTEVHREDWTLIQARRIIPFNLSAAEESGAGGRVQRADNRAFYHFIATFFDGANPIWTTPAAALWLEAGVREPPSGGVDQTARDAAAAADAAASAAERAAIAAGEVADRAEGKADANTAGLASEVADRTAADREIGVRIENIDRDFSVDPDYFVRDVAPTETRTFILHDHADDRPAGATYALLRIADVPAQAREQLSADDTSYAFTFAAVDVGTLSRVPRSTLAVSLEYFDRADGGVVLARTRELIRLVAEAPGGDAEIEALDTRVTALEGADATANPIIMNIASYDAAQDRFEDSSGNAVALPAGAIVLTTQAIYDAAVADGFAFPASVIFLTR